MSDIRDILKNNIDIADFLIASENVAILLLDKDNNISSCNDCFINLLQLTEKPLGKDIVDFLLPESQSVFPLSNKQSLMMNFISAVKTPVPLSCFVSEINDGTTLIIGTKLMLTNDHVLDQMTLMANELSNMARELKSKNRELEDAHANIKILSGIIPICMHCKEIRDDEGFWNNLEMFISKNSEARFSHGICPDCVEKHYKGMIKKSD